MILFNTTFTPGLPDWVAAAVAVVFFAVLPAVVFCGTRWLEARRAEAGPDPLAGYAWMRLAGDVPARVREARR